MTICSWRYTVRFGSRQVFVILENRLCHPGRSWAAWSCCSIFIRFYCFILGVIGSGHYCVERGFKDEVRELAKTLVPITRRLWQLTKVSCLIVLSEILKLDKNKVPLRILLKLSLGYMYTGFRQALQSRVEPNAELSVNKVWRLKQLGVTGCARTQKIDCWSRSELLWSAFVSAVDLGMSRT